MTTTERPIWAFALGTAVFFLQICFLSAQRNLYFGNSIPIRGRPLIPPLPSPYGTPPLPSPYRSPYNDFQGFGGFNSFDAATDIIDSELHGFEGGRGFPPNSFGNAFDGGFVREFNYAGSHPNPFFIQPSYGSQYTFLRRSADDKV